MIKNNAFKFLIYQFNVYKIENVMPVGNYNTFIDINYVQ